MEIDLSIIVAMTQERLIGNKGRLPWGHLPSDLARFKQITMETGVVVMGRRTYISIVEPAGVPLPGRKHIVLTRKGINREMNDAAQFVGSVEEALAKVAEYGGHACVIGGGEIFKLFLPLQQVRTAYITTVYAPKLSGDTFFPEITKMEWQSIKNSGVRRWNPNDEYETSFETYKR